MTMKFGTRKQTCLSNQRHSSILQREFVDWTELTSLAMRNGSPRVTKQTNNSVGPQECLVQVKSLVSCRGASAHTQLINFVLLANQSLPGDAPKKSDKVRDVSHLSPPPSEPLSVLAENHVTQLLGKKPVYPISLSLVGGAQLALKDDGFLARCVLCARSALLCGRFAGSMCLLRDLCGWLMCSSLSERRCDNVLKEIDVSGNKLKTLTMLGALDRLKRIIANKCVRIAALDSALLCMYSRVPLSNRISDVDLSHLAALELLALSHNRMAQLPRNLHTVAKSLVQLDLVRHTAQCGPFLIRLHGSLTTT